MFDLRRGGIASLVEKKTGRDLVDHSSPYALGQFLHERFSNQQMAATNRPREDLPPDTTYAAMSPSRWTIDVEKTTYADVATLTATGTLGLAKGIALVVTLPYTQPWVEVEWRINEKTPDPAPEGGWLCFPLAVAEPRFVLGRLGGPVDPANDIAPGANRDYFCLSSGLTIRGRDKTGVGLCPIDSPCVSLG